MIGDQADVPPAALPLLGYAPALHPRALGDPSFRQDLGVRYAYVVGAMANGITSVEMVRAAGRSGMVGFFGAGGLSLDQVAHAIDELQAESPSFPFGFNLIHSPNDPKLEWAVVELYLRRNITLVSASAFLALTEPLVFYRVKGIRRSSDGRIVCPNRVVAKVSRVEVARKFFAPPPQKILDRLVQQGKITQQEADLARYVPMAQDITAEADSGGHTDNRPALTLLPTFLELRDTSQAQFKYATPLRVGLAGGIATPDAAAAAFAMGAAYILTGSINQPCVEADTSSTVKKMLTQAEQADVIMAPAADMFELGAKVQVLKRGTMFAMRGAKLYELYRNSDSYEEIPSDIRAGIERDLLRATFEQTWRKTRDYFLECDPGQVDRAEADPKHKMALVFRSYLGLSSIWAKTGAPERRMDYQIWCGPAMGAFNAWARGSFLQEADQRRTAEVAMNLLYGAACLTRCHWLRTQGVFLPPMEIRPLPLAEIEEYFT
ncbi:MAG: PfaD family polyunsaturated fatty acid/polyketide biosynthesis protein [Desulfosarcinaceae bacterium]